MLGNKWKSVVHLLHMEMVYYYKMSQNVEIVSNLRPRKILAEGSTYRLSTLTFGRTFSLFTSIRHLTCEGTDCIAKGSYKTKERKLQNYDYYANEWFSYHDQRV